MNLNRLKVEIKNVLEQTKSDLEDYFNEWIPWDDEHGEGKTETGPDVQEVIGLTVMLEIGEPEVGEEQIVFQISGVVKLQDAMQVQEHYVQVKGPDRIQLESSGWYQPFTEDKRKLFRAMQKEHGRCTGKMYAEDPSVKPIGWIFEKQVKYEDSNNTYLLETWVELSTEAR